MSIAQENGTKSWGYVTGDFIDGIGYIGPENAVDNRKRKITITGSSFNPLVFSKKDVKSVDVVCASSDWIKFRICLKDGKVAVATFVDVNKDPMGVLTFEWWLADVMYKNASPVKKAAPKKAPAPAPVEEAKPVEEAPKVVEATPVVEKKSTEKAKPVVEKKPAAKKAPAKKAEPKEEKKEEPAKKAPAKKAEPKEEKKEEPKKEKKAPAKKKAAPKKKPAPKKEAEEEIVVSEEVKRQVERLEEDPWRLYQFAQQVMGAKSYQVAYYALKKMKAKMDADPKLAKNPDYKNVPAMLNSVKEEVEYNYKG